LIKTRNGKKKKLPIAEMMIVSFGPTLRGLLAAIGGSCWHANGCGNSGVGHEWEGGGGEVRGRAAASSKVVVLM
jgi:hypothetical protein